jgi:hypothetical protein
VKCIWPHNGVRSTVVPYLGLDDRSTYTEAGYKVVLPLVLLLSVSLSVTLGIPLAVLPVAVLL